jgi:non-ribosomal peptide synthetase component F
VRDALRHQRYRYEDILRDLKLVGRSGLYPLLVNIVSFDYDVQFGGASSSAHGLGGINFNDLSVSVYDRSSDGRMSVVVEANPDLYSRKAVQEHAAQFLDVLNWMASSAADERVHRITLMSRSEQRRVLEEWNDTAREVTAATLPELFQAQASRTPDATAVVFEGAEVTYADLNARANRLARLLIDRGVGPESPVAVMMHRSVDLVVALLAVVKAGGAYVPVDPDYPAVRVTHVLADARPRLVLTSTDLASRLTGGEVPRLAVVGYVPAAGRRGGATKRDSARLRSRRSATRSAHVAALPPSSRPVHCCSRIFPFVIRPSTSFRGFDGTRLLRGGRVTPRVGPRDDAPSWKCSAGVRACRTGPRRKTRPPQGVA